MPLQGEWQSFSRHIPTRTAATILRRCLPIGYSPVRPADGRAHLHACGLERPAVCGLALRHVSVTNPLSRQNAMERPRLATTRPIRRRPSATAPPGVRAGMFTSPRPRVVAQSSRALLRRSHGKADSARGSPFDRRSGTGDHRIHRDRQRGPQALPVAQNSR